MREKQLFSNGDNVPRKKAIANETVVKVKATRSIHSHN